MPIFSATTIENSNALNLPKPQMLLHERIQNKQQKEAQDSDQNHKSTDSEVEEKKVHHENHDKERDSEKSHINESWYSSDDDDDVDDEKKQSVDLPKELTDVISAIKQAPLTEEKSDRSSRDPR